MKKKIILSLALLFLCGAFPLGNTFADQNDPTPPDQGGITDDPQSEGSEEPSPPAPEIPSSGSGYGVTWGRDIIFYKENESRLTAQKIAYEDKNGENICDSCIARGKNYEYENGILTLNNFGTQSEKLVLEVTGVGTLEIKLQGDNYFNLEAIEGSIEIILSGNGTMNGDIRSVDGPGYGISSNIVINGPKINSETIYNMFGSVVINNGEVNVENKTGISPILYGKGGFPASASKSMVEMSVQNLEINGGKLNIESQGTGIEIINRTGYSPSEDPGIIVNGGELSIIAKDNVINERYHNNTDYDFKNEKWYSVLAKDTSEKLYDNLIVLGSGVGIKETDITTQRYKILNESIISGIGDRFLYEMTGQKGELYTYYSSLSYGDYKITKGGTSIRDAVKVLHISKDFKNQLSKNSKIGVIDTLKNVKQEYSFGYSSETRKVELEKIEIDGKAIDISKFDVSRRENYDQSASGVSYSALDVNIPPKTLFELGAGKHTILFHFKEPGIWRFIPETSEEHYTNEEEYEFEIAESFKDYEYLLTYIDNPILEGEDETLTVGESTPYRVRFDRNIQLFDGFTIDGKEVPETYYEVKSGSTIIEIKPEFLDTLSPGKHEISANFLAEDAPLVANFTMVKADKDVEPEKENKPENKDEKTTEDKTANNPGTGLYSKDSSFASSSTLITVTIIVAVSTIALAIWSIKTKRFKH